MQDFLTEVVRHKLEELEQKEQKRPLSSLRKCIEPASGRFLQALSGEGLKIIAEIKPRSPSAGQLDEGIVNQQDRLALYQSYAQAVSVLCDKRYFGGSVELLGDIAKSISLPTLLKDFVISPYQVYEARQAGAEAVLLIVKILKQTELEELNALVLHLGMTPVVEVQCEEELKRAGLLKPELLLINNRNLDTLQIDLKTVERLLSKINFDTRVIAASGIENAEHFLAIRPFAARFLIGSALMAGGDPASKFKEFRDAESAFLQKTREAGSSCR